MWLPIGFLYRASDSSDMAVIKLTKRAIDGLKPRPGADYFVWDAELKGFGIRVAPAGRKVFALGYRARGSRQFRRLTLGAYGPLTPDEARRIAKSQLGAIAEGADPATARQDVRRAPTVAELGEHYLADARARRKPSTAVEYARLWKKHVVPALATRKVAAVTTADVARLHRAMRDTPYVANRTLSVMGAFFTFAAREGIRTRHDNPARMVEFYPEHARERFLTAEEFTRLGEALARAERDGTAPAPVHRRRPRSPATAKHRPKSADTPKPANPFTIAALRILALTGCREGEILSLRWDAVDFERGFLRLADTKTGRSIRPLGAAAADVLAGLPRDAGSPYVFPGLTAGSHLREIKKVWAAVRHAAKLDGVRLHDLRHSFGSVSAIGGDSLLVIRALLGHADVTTTQRYAHLGDDPARNAADRASGTIASWLSGRGPLPLPLPRAERRSRWPTS